DAHFVLTCVAVEFMQNTFWHLLFQTPIIAAVCIAVRLFIYNKLIFFSKASFSCLSRYSFGVLSMVEKVIAEKALFSLLSAAPLATTRWANWPMTEMNI
ncbi:hypothetical protein ACJX0J_013713, partial [Zea mays]